MIARALSLLGLMKRSEHAAEKLRIANSYAARIFGLEDDLRVARESLKIEKDAGAEAEERFKRAATDLAEQAGEIARQDDTIERMAWEIKRHEDEIRERKQVQYDLARARLEIEALRPDALKWRNYLKRSRDRKAGKKGVANG